MPAEVQCGGRGAPATFCKKDLNALTQNLHFMSGTRSFRVILLFAFGRETFRTSTLS
jgi:hypothetical protein